MGPRPKVVANQPRAASAFSAIQGFDFFGTD
jgi:hypothetical protein